MGLFKKKGDKSPAPAAANPYAQPPINPYQAAKSKAYNPPGPGADQGAPPPPYSGNGRGGTPFDGDKKHPYDNGYGQQDRSAGGGYGGGGYNSNPYGGQGGYGGADRYGTSGGAGGQQGGPQQGGSRYGAGGYGGMGGRDPYQPEQKDDTSRNALFANPNQGKAPAQPPQQGGPSGAPSRQNAYDAANPIEGGFDSTGGYTPTPAYQDRELTAEEEEAQEIENAKNEIRQIKREDVSATRNALAAANRAEEIGRDTLARLGAQGEMIHNTEKNLDLAHNHNKTAEERARELKTLNRSMFAVHVSNPFTSKSRREAQEQAVIDRHLEERDAREATRRAAFLSDQRMQKNFKDMDQQSGGQQQQRRERNLAERAKYQFEADSEDEDMENEIDANLDALSGAATRLHTLAKATGKEVDAQNEHLERIAGKSDRVDVGLASNRARIDRIK